MANTLERVLDAMSPSLQSFGAGDKDADDKDADDARRRLSSIDETVFDLQRVLGLLTDLMNADDADLERVLSRNGSYQSLKDNVRGVLQKVMSSVGLSVKAKADSDAQAKGSDDRPDTKASSK